MPSLSTVSIQVSAGQLVQRPDPRNQEVGVGIAEKERRLIEGQAQRPDSRGSAEPRNDPLAHHGLDEEDQERTREDRRSEEKRSSQGPPERPLRHVAKAAFRARRG